MLIIFTVDLFIFGQVCVIHIYEIINLQYMG